MRRDSSVPAADDLDLTSSLTAAGPASAAPGIKRFVAVDLKLAGGSAPSSEGLKWLAEKGYRTILDLRDSAEVPPSFIAEVTGMGLRYLALPVNLKAIDRDHVDRFNFEMAAGDARPLFFFDSDGTRAGTLWYIRRIATDHVDDQIARREAQELGLSDSGFWQAATNYVDRIGGTRASAAARPTTPAPGPAASAATSANETTKVGDSRENQPASPTPGAGTAPQQSAAPANTGAGPVGASASTGNDATNPQGSNSLSPSTALPLSESLAWRPLAAMLITGLTLPLAYWSRSLPPAIVSIARASLPAPAHQPRSLPGESGA
jgi:protein tyrosine phosphatase (PTP) superfamily phosphohydrolase (DUF442 family)